MTTAEGSAMYQPQSGYEAVFQTNQRRQSQESRLVLDAAGIAAETIFHEGVWILLVKQADAAIAATELQEYQHENPPRAPVARTPRPRREGALAGVCVYAGTIILIAIQNAQSAYGFDWQAAGRVHAAKVMAGQWWRTVTALTLHGDIGHLAGNIVFGIVFGLLAGRILGGGVAWLAILLAGALGNGMNAWIQDPAHLSIGASTSVFAALGVLVSHALRGRAKQTEPERPLKRWSPLIGGIALLGFTGVGGENTDVAAHFTGFVAGMLLGWAGSRLPNHWLASQQVQWTAAVLSIAIVVVAWCYALFQPAL
ncbi:MAG: rhomboid family intramembrane serine protease [Rubripirellula sp.]